MAEANWQLFDGAGTISPLVQVTRGSGGSSYSASGVLEQVGPNGPRYNYDFATGKRGLWVEEQRTNLLTYSEQFDNAAWTKTRVSVTADSVMSPDGTLDADKLVENADTGAHSLTWTQTITAGVAYVLTLYAKEDSTSAKRFLTLYANSGFTGTAPYGCTFNLGDGTVERQQNGFTGTITPVGSGWYRCAVFTTLSTSTSAGMRISLSNSASGSVPQSYTGDGTSGIFIWGAQLEAGAFATSYIPTTTAAATRARDVPQITGTDFASFWNPSGGTLFVEASTASTVIVVPLSISDGTFGNSIYGNFSNGTSYLGSNVIVSGVNQTSSIFPFDGIDAAAGIKSAFAFTENYFAESVNALGVRTDMTGAVPTVNRMYLGANGRGTGSYLNGTIWQSYYIPRPLSAVQLAQLTSGQSSFSRQYTTRKAKSFFSFFLGP